MSAEVLREAAALMREEAQMVRRPYGRAERVAEAVADWLEAAAGRIPDDCACAECSDYEPEALAVARLYLGSAS